MRAYVTACPVGLFAIDEKKKLVAHRPFPKDPATIAELVRKFEAGQTFAELERLLLELRKEGYEDVSVEQPNLATDWVRDNFRRFALEQKIVKDQAELNALLAAVGTAQARVMITKIERRDKLIAQSINALNDMDKILNAMSERLREWYGLHYPEYKPGEHEKFVEAIVKHGSRENFENFKTSMGMPLAAGDVSMLQRYAARLKELYALRAELEKYLGEVVPVEMPNTTALLGPLLAARILAQAGSLEKLAKMPSSTVQLLGAEKALFKALRAKGKEARVPRFGILFTYPAISGAKREIQGKIARLLAAKVSIAARTDFYTKEDHGKEFKESFDNKLKELLKEGKTHE